MEYVRVLVALVCVLIYSATAFRIPQKRWAVDDDGCRTPDRGVGSCLRISECQTMLDYLSTKETLTQKEKNALFSYRCGVYQDEPKVCCSNKPIDLGWTVEEDRCLTPDGGDGVCLDIKECKIIYNFIAQNDLTDPIRKAINEYKCGSTSNIQVCCPPMLPERLMQLNFENRILDYTQHKNANLLPQDCGLIYSGQKITNGNETSLLEFPWAAVLKYDKEVNSWGCGGTLINERYVLTAAHCVRSQNRLTTVRLGEYDFRMNPDCTVGEQAECASPHQDFEVSKDDAIVHPNYSENTYQNDIALIRLRTPANMSVYNVAPLCLPLTIAEQEATFKSYTVIGWGATETGYASPVLLKVEVPRVANADCAPKYVSRTNITDNQLCAGGRREQDSCAGDSGGPLMATYGLGVSFRTIQYGIVSLGPRICGKEGFPALYTSVSKYVGWILDNMKP